MYKTIKTRISWLLIVTFVFTTLIIPVVNAEIFSNTMAKLKNKFQNSKTVQKIKSFKGLNRQHATKSVKWLTYGGMALGGILGLCTGGIGGLLLGTLAGAALSVATCSLMGVPPEDQWQIVKPKGWPWIKYNRQTANAGNGGALPAASSVAPGVAALNISAAQAKQTNAKLKENAAEIKAKYVTAYKKYTRAVKEGKSGKVLEKVLDAYKKAKAKFKSLFK